MPEVLLVVAISTSTYDVKLNYLIDGNFSVLSTKFGWDEEGVDILGSVPINPGSSFVQFPVSSRNLKHIRRTTSTAVYVYTQYVAHSCINFNFTMMFDRLISVVGFLDSIVAAKQNSARFGYSISPNRELVALGASNLVASFVPGTLPAYGSITR